MTQTGIKRILIFDDDADFRKLLTARLGSQFEEVELEEYDPVARGIPGKDFDWSRYDVLLLDYNLKAYGLTGLDILQANRKNPQFPAAIMLTGAGNEEVAVRALKAGVYDYMRKDRIDKGELHRAIIDAYGKQQTERQRLNDLTHQSHAFNKALFYQQLEQHQQRQEGESRVLLLISLDNHRRIEEQAGLIIRDNFIRHIARQSYEFYLSGQFNPNITRFSDTSVALLVDDTGSDDTLASALEGLCNHLKSTPFKHENNVFRFSVSIGVVRLYNHIGMAEAVIRAARHSCTLAAKQNGNSFHVFDEPLESITHRSPEHEKPQAPPADSPAPPATGKPPAPPAQPPSGEVEQETGTPPLSEKPKQVEHITETGTTTADTQQPASVTPEKPEAPTDDTASKEMTTDSGVASEETSPSQPDEAEPAPAAPAVEKQEIEEAFNENRITQTFQSIISLIGDEEETEGYATYYVSLQMLNKDGAILGADEIYTSSDPELRQSIDRWMLREAIGRIVNSNSEYLFLIRLSKASLADASLFNWLRKLLSGYDDKRPGRSIALELDATDFIAVQKPAVALITYLEKSHGFKFVLGNIRRDNDLDALCSKGQFNLIRLDHQLLREWAEIPPDQKEEEGGSAISSVKSQGIQIIADNIEDAMTLTGIISTGVEYAMGPFIGEPMEQIDDHTNVESFEII